AGGNAVDAAVATAFTLAVTRPVAGNLGGGGFAVVRSGKGKESALDFREVAPAAATSDMYDAAGPKASLIGMKAVGVPGSVAGLWQLHEKFGKRKWAAVIAPAIRYAKEGFPVRDELHDDIVRREHRAVFAGPLGALLVPGGKPLTEGAILKN